jgi:hypothetical protein
MIWRGNAEERSTMTIGCVIAFGSAVLTGFMLFINGSLVMAVLAALARSGPSWASNPEFSQFMLFLIPVLMVIAEWMMIDYVRSRFRRHPTEQ